MKIRARKDLIQLFIIKSEDYNRQKDICRRKLSSNSVNLNSSAYKESKISVQQMYEETAAIFTKASSCLFIGEEKKDETTSTLSERLFSFLIIYYNKRNDQEKN